MLGRILLGALAISLMSVIVCGPSYAAIAAIRLAAAQPDPSVMQQMDYQRRMNHERQADIDRKQINDLAAAQGSSIGADYIVLILLATSGIGFFLVSRRGGRARPIRKRHLPRPK
jgi:hypothetical protein